MTSIFVVLSTTTSKFRLTTTSTSSSSVATRPTRPKMRTNPDLDSPEWPVRKVLKGRDIDNGQLVIMPIPQDKDYILRQLERKSVKGGDDYLPITVKDLDTLSEYKLSLWKNAASGSYVLSGGWKSSFVMRRELQVDDEVGFRFDDGKLHFAVLSPRPIHGLD